MLSCFQLNIFFDRINKTSPNNTIRKKKQLLLYQLNHIHDKNGLAIFHYNKLISNGCKLMDVEIASEWITMHQLNIKH
jgi:hypothetical protein